MKFDFYNFEGKELISLCILIRKIKNFIIFGGNSAFTQPLLHATEKFKYSAQEYHRQEEWKRILQTNFKRI